MPRMIIVESEGLKEMVDGFDKAKPTLRKNYNRNLGIILENLRSEAVMEAPVDTGQLRGAIRSQTWPTPSGFSRGVVIADTKYAVSVHEGRKPGSFPPRRAIEPWARRHGLPWYPVAKKIFEKGTKPRPFFDKALKSERQNINNLLGKVLVDVVRDLSK